MSIRDDLKQVKQEFSNDEKILESAFKFEVFLRKNKILLLSLIGFVVALVAGFQVKNYLDEKRALKISAIFAEIQNNEASQELLEKLKKEGKELYEFIALSQAIKNQNKDELLALQNSSNPFIAKYSSYEFSSLAQAFDSQKDYGEFKNLVLLQEGYLLISKNEHQKALEKLNAIEPTSELKEWALRTGHYGIAR